MCMFKKYDSTFDLNYLSCSSRKGKLNNAFNNKLKHVSSIFERLIIIQQQYWVVVSTDVHIKTQNNIETMYR